MGLGASPVSGTLARRWRGLPDGMACISARVYGWAGWSKMARTGPISTMRPRYMMATTSLTCSTTDRSWLMNT